MLKKVKAYIQEHNLLDSRGHYLVALSGGADSVCLLLVLKQLGYNIDAVHCNFHLRGEESNRDENFAKELCEKNRIELHITHFDTLTYSKTHKVSIEMAARQLRYHYFEQLMNDIGAQGICVAHHKDDSAETILINLLRGTGIHGLTGIKPRNGNILRPLLCTTRNDIEKWLANHHQNYVTDSTNLKADILRNIIRLDILPRIEEVVPSATESIISTAEKVYQASLIYDNTISLIISKLRHTKEDTQSIVSTGLITSLDINSILREPSPESILFEWLNPLGFTPEIIAQIHHSIKHQQAGKEWTSPTHQLTISRGQLIIEQRQEQLPELRIPEYGRYRYTEKLIFNLSVTNGKRISRNSRTATLDASTVTFPLTIRPTQKGDRFHPFGMKGSCLVSDYLTNRHFTIFQKRRTLVLCNADGRIIWLIGQRTDARFCITDATEITLTVDTDS